MARRAVDVRRRYLQALGHGAPAALHPRSSHEPLHSSPLRTSSADRLDSLGLDGRHSPLVVTAASLAPPAAAPDRPRSTSASTSGTGLDDSGSHDVPTSHDPRPGALHAVRSHRSVSEVGAGPAASSTLSQFLWSSSLPAVSGLLGLEVHADVLSGAGAAPGAAASLHGAAATATRAIPMRGRGPAGAAAGSALGADGRGVTHRLSIGGAAGRLPIPARAASARAGGVAARASDAGTDSDSHSHDDADDDADSRRSDGREGKAWAAHATGLASAADAASGSGSVGADEESESRSHGAASSAVGGGGGGGLGFDFDDAPQSRRAPAPLVAARRRVAAAAADADADVDADEGDEEEDGDGIGDLPTPVVGTRGARGSAAAGMIGLLGRSGGGSGGSGSAVGSGATVRRASLDAQAALQAAGLLSSSFVPPHLQHLGLVHQRSGGAAGAPAGVLGGEAGGGRPVEKARPRNF